MKVQKTAPILLGAVLCQGLSPTTLSVRPSGSAINALTPQHDSAQAPRKTAGAAPKGSANATSMRASSEASHLSDQADKTAKPKQYQTTSGTYHNTLVPQGLCCPLLPNYVPNYSPNDSALNQSILSCSTLKAMPNTWHEQDSGKSASSNPRSSNATRDNITKLSNLKGALYGVLAEENLNGKISWRIKAANSTLGKFILRAIHSDPKQPLHVRDSQHACQLIADNHYRLIAFVEQLHAANETPKILLDQLGLRIILTDDASAKDCLRLAQSIKAHLSISTTGDEQGLNAFALNTFAKAEKDYISHPKDNGYQSYHLSLIASARDSQDRSDSQPIELQIRTQSMHKDATQGDACHDTYKQNQRLLLDAFSAYYGSLGEDTGASADHEKNSLSSLNCTV